MSIPVNYDKLTPQQRKQVREQYVSLQGGKCYHCNEPLTSQPAKSVLNKRVVKSVFPPNFFKWPVHLHHCHNTGKTIGAVHCYCNAVLWQYYGE